MTEDYLSSPDTPMSATAPAIAEPIFAEAARQPCLRRVASADPGCWALFGRLLLWATRNARKEAPPPNRGDISA